MQNPIPYNDIDIFHKDIDFARYIAGKPFKPLSTEQGRKELKAVQYVRFQPHMDINYVCLSSTADLQARVHESDINAVAIGVLVTLNWIKWQRKGHLIEQHHSRNSCRRKLWRCVISDLLSSQRMP